MSYDKPLPVLGPDNRPFWDGCKAGELRVQRCEDCRHLRYPIASFCPECLSSRAVWTAVSGRGEVYSCIVFHRAYHPSFANDLPYAVGLIALQEGPRMISNIIGKPASDVRVGDKVQAVFDPATDEITIPKFKIVEPAAGR